ncbi:hypothetical protein BDV96DRAFT_194962 [Lophiotrema nucula]|uniref:F-box domain-containing protein n=1 Tax=Lophiotrema nucula TaxID=690887 RepID=A0A6A5YV73_9PLEO|nr:hypothetical protein BDV96DRAFT_194962 [Lophiotrema nucula]
MALRDDEFPPLPSQRTIARCQPATLGKLRKAPARKHDGLATIMDLPDELLLEILKHLPPLDQVHFQLGSILSLSLVNRRFHDVVAEHLYANYNSLFCGPFPFLRTMMSNSVISQLVQSINFRYGPGVHSSRPTYIRSLADRRVIKAGFKVLDIPDWKSWANDCCNEDCEQDLLYAAILAHTRNVTNLEVDDGEVAYHVPKWIEIIRHAAGRAPFGQVHRFPHLKSIQIDIGRLRLRNLSPLFRLPSLRTVLLRGLMETSKVVKGDPFPFKWSITASSSSIEELLLPDCTIDSTVLAALLGSCRAIKKLKYEHVDHRWPYLCDRLFPWWEDRNDDGHFGFAPLHYPTIAKALHRHKSTLEDLHLAHNIVETRHYKYRLIGHLGSLQDTQNITELRTTFRALLDIATEPASILVELLPPSLTTLVFVIDYFHEHLECMRALEHLAVYGQEYLPKLEVLSLEIGAVDDNFNFSRRLRINYDFEHLQKLLRENGVKLFVNGTDDGFNKHVKTWKAPSWDSTEESESESDDEPLYSDDGS